jgi:hypothetical protein
MDSRAQVFVSLKTGDMTAAKAVLTKAYPTVREEEGYLRVYDEEDTAAIVTLLMENGYPVSEIRKNKIGLEEYYVELMSRAETEKEDM